MAGKVKDGTDEHETRKSCEGSLGLSAVCDIGRLCGADEL